MTKYPRILIVGTTPYDVNESSRALDTYFHNFPKENLRMIFSKNYLPPKGHCSSMYQITDYDVLQKFLGKTKEVGRVLNYENLQEKPVILEEKLRNYKKKSVFRYYARKALWAKKRWLTSSLESWVNEFKPEAIYICFSDDYFILDIASYFIDKYNIPVIAQIGDDYYFKKYSFLMKPYLNKYRKLFSQIMNYEGFGVYISQKLADKYNSNFKLQGYPFYLNSNVVCYKKEIKYRFNYIGKIGLGRDKSLECLGNLLHECDKAYVLNIYTKDRVSKAKIKHFYKNNCIYKGPISYFEAKELIESGGFNVIASGFKEKEINESRYSLSTKVSDLLASSGPIIAIGGTGDGAIDFFKKYDCSLLINSIKIHSEGLKNLLNNGKLLKEKITNANKLSKELFSLEKNRNRFESLCFKLVAK